MTSITSPRGANATRSRDQNRQLVLGHLHASGALGRAERARRSDLTGAPVWQRRLPLDAATLDAVGAARDRLLGAGVVMPGWEEIDAQALLGRTLGMPVTVENDANAAAISERVAGAVDGLTDFACLYFGAGLGLGLVGDGRLIGGAFGNAGEIGHIPVQAADGPVLLESVLSRLSTKRALAAANIEAQDIETLQKMFGTSNSDLMGWLDSTLAPLSQAVALIENMFDPQIIVLCGVMPEPMVRYLIDHVDLPMRMVSRRADRAHPARAWADAVG